MGAAVMKPLKTLTVRIPVTQQTLKMAQASDSLRDEFDIMLRGYLEHQRRLREEPGYRERCERASVAEAMVRRAIEESPEWEAIQREQDRLFGLLSQLDEKRRDVYAAQGLTYTGYWDDE